ncbi:MAG: CHRD domain-containing protein [Sulfuricellaceae bacterium]
MRTLIHTLAAISFAMLGSSTTLADIYAFPDVALTPEQQSPAPQSDGKGWLNALYDSTTKTLTYVVNWQLKSGNVVSVSHFHGPAAIGENAGAQIGVTLPSTNTGKMGGSVTLTPSQESDLLAGKWYFNIHSAAFPAGEIRGQLVEKSSTYNGAVFNTGTGTVTFANVYAPGSGIYDVTMTLKSTSPSMLFELTSATKTR